MSDLIEPINLTLYGCPMHYIKARESLQLIEIEHAVLLVVNNGDAVTEVLKSLRHDGHVCELESQQTLTSTIRVTKKHD